MRGVAILALFLGLAFVGMLVMFIAGARAKNWLSKNADPEHGRLRGIALVMRYAEIRAYHGKSTTLATAFWIGRPSGDSASSASALFWRWWATQVWSVPRAAPRLPPLVESASPGAEHAGRSQ